jgi:hypothetical protein
LAISVEIEQFPLCGSRRAHEDREGRTKFIGRGRRAHEDREGRTKIAKGARRAHETRRAAFGGALTARELGFGKIWLLTAFVFTLPYGDAGQWP